MTSYAQQLEDDAAHAHLASSGANVVGAGALVASLPELNPQFSRLARSHPAGGPLAHSTGIESGAAMGTVGLLGGMANTAEGVTAFRAARERGRHATGDAATAARDDQVNAIGTTTSGVLGTASSGAALAQRALVATASNDALLGAGQVAERTAGRIGTASGVSRVLGQAGGVVNMAQGGYNLVRGIQDRHASGDRPDQQMSDGTLQLVGGLGAVVGGLGAPLSAGIAGGMALNEVGNAHAMATGVLGQSGVTTHRGFAPTSAAGPEPEANANISATDAAVAAGQDVARHFDHRTEPGRTGTFGGDAVGALAAGLLTPFTLGASLAHQAGVFAPFTGSADIEARDANERGVPLPRSDHSQQAELRRRDRRRRDREAAAQQQATEAHHAAISQQASARDMMPNETRANEQFTNIAGPGAASIERRALGTNSIVSEDEIARSIIEGSQ